MQRDTWEQAIARAVVERSFRARLLADPAGTLADYGMDGSDTSFVENVHVNTLEQLTVQLLQLTRQHWQPAA